MSVSYFAEKAAYYDNLSILDQAETWWEEKDRREVRKHKANVRKEAMDFVASLFTEEPEPIYYTIWERKSARHNWQAVTERQTLESAQAMIDYQRERMKEFYGDSTRWQVGMNQRKGLGAENTLPRNAPMLNVWIS